MARGAMWVMATAGREGEMGEKHVTERICEWLCWHVILGEKRGCEPRGMMQRREEERRK